MPKTLTVRAPARSDKFDALYRIAPFLEHRASRSQVHAADSWLIRKEIEWAAAGRITDRGRLLMRSESSPSLVRAARVTQAQILRASKGLPYAGPKLCPRCYKQRRPIGLSYCRPCRRDYARARRGVVSPRPYRKDNICPACEIAQRGQRNYCRTCNNKRAREAMRRIRAARRSQAVDAPVTAASPPNPSVAPANVPARGASALDDPGASTRI